MDEDDDAPRIPRDALVIQELLGSMGVQKYDPQVIAQLMELSHRYVTEILRDSEDYRIHSSKEKIDEKDVALAVDMRKVSSFTAPPSREVLADLARERNAIPLSVVPDRAGVLLPPERYCLSKPNYQVQTPRSS